MRCELLLLFVTELCNFVVSFDSLQTHILAIPANSNLDTHGKGQLGGDWIVLIA